jgi:hypothetical protein
MEVKEVNATHEWQQRNLSKHLPPQSPVKNASHKMILGSFSEGVQASSLVGSGGGQ